MSYCHSTVSKYINKIWLDSYAEIKFSVVPFATVGTVAIYKCLKY